MKVFGNFVFVKGEKQEKDGRVYCNVTLECCEDEDVVTMSCSPDVLPKLKKYSKYNFAIDIFDYMKDGKRNTVKSVIDVKPV